MPKKRPNGDGGLYYLRSRKLWRGVIDDGFKPDGTRRQRYVHAKTQTEARAKLNQLRDEIAKHGAPIDKTMTVERWAEHWLETVCRPTMKPAGFQSYESLTRHWIIPEIGKKRIATLRPSDIRSVTQAVTRAGRADATALKVHRVLSTMLESARLDNSIGRNVVRDVASPRQAEVDGEALTDEQALRILQAALRHPDGVRWWFAILTGMRQGERLGATLDSIDREARQFTVQWNLTRARFEHGCGGVCGYKRAGGCPERRLRLADGLTYRPLDGGRILVRPKSGKVRSFLLIPALERLLDEYLSATADVPNPHGLIWRNPDGSPIDDKQDSQAWRDLLCEAGIITAVQALPPRQRPEGTPEPPPGHTTRHTTATVLMELGVDAKIIGEIVGHGSERITRHYQHVSTPAAQAAMGAIGERFSRALDA